MVGYRIRDGDGQLDFALPQSGPGWSGVLAADSYLVVSIAAPGVLTDSSDGDSVILLTSENVGVDFVRYGNCTDAPPAGTIWTGTNPQAPVQGQSLGRNKDSKDTNNASDWENTGGIDVNAPTPGKRNVTDSGISASVGASPSSLTANGTSTSTITATVRDADGNPVVDETVTMEITQGTGAISNVTDNRDGTYTATYVYLPLKTGDNASVFL